MFDASADLYDLIYAPLKDYDAEAAAVAQLLRDRHPACRTILDAACGTGEHARRLATLHGFAVDGFDLNPTFVRLAAAKHPGGRFARADMRDFRFPQRYDAVLCLFSSIGYVRTLDGLHRSLRCFAAHVALNGLVVVEPWFEPGAMQDGYETAVEADAPHLRVVRHSRTEVVGRLSRLHFEYEVRTAEGTRTLRELHELGLFTVTETLEAFAAAGLLAEHDEHGITGRGIYVARAAQAAPDPGSA